MINMLFEFETTDHAGRFAAAVLSGGFDVSTSRCGARRKYGM